MSWLSDRTGIHWNLRPLAAPVGGIVGGLLGGPAGAALGAGLFKAGDNKAHGDSWTHALEQGALNGGLAYGAGMLGNAVSGGGGSAAGTLGPQLTPSNNLLQGPGSAALNLGNTGSDVSHGVMSRVLGHLGDATQWAERNKTAVDFAGRAGGAIVDAAEQNKALGIQGKLANAQAAEIQAAIDRQKASAAAYAKFFANAAPGAPAGNTAGGAAGGASGQRSLAPGQMRPDEISGAGGAPQVQQPTSDDPANPGAPAGGPGAPPTPTAAAVMSRLGYDDPYAGNGSVYGSPYGYGYSSQGYFNGGGY